MMRVGLQGWGSEGDLRPLLALAARLRAEGHLPELVVTPVDGVDYVTPCRELGIPLRRVPSSAPVTLEQLASEAKSANPTKLMKALLDSTFYPHLEAMYEAGLDLCARSDVVVGGSSSWMVKAAALETGVPFVSLHYYPGLVPSRVVPPAIFPNWRWLARPGWALLRLLMDFAFRAPVRKFFAEKGLPPIRHAIPDVLFSDRLNLLAASPSFWPPAPDWPSSFCVSGELRSDVLQSWRPSHELEAFLQSGEPPVLMSLGSMEHMAPARSRDLLIESARAAGVRAIIQSKASPAEGQDGTLYFLPWAPHTVLAPRCGALIHHGGAGTSHAALRSGVPSLVLPFIFEQALWAKRLRQVGAAGPAMSFWRARPERVGAALRATLADPGLRERARGLSRAMQDEDGAGTAVQRLSQLLDQVHGPESALER